MITEDYIKTHGLKQCLEAFQGAEQGIGVKEREDEVEKAFTVLAKKILYGGFLKVGEDYRILIRTVEFYYHEEEGCVKDNYVYHRNGKFKSRADGGHDREVPYFPVMTLHSHWSGYDITFENPLKRYRASILIREYAVFDIKEGKYAYWDTRSGQFNYLLSDTPVWDSRSSYLTYFLNGFPIEKGASSRIEWEDTMPEEYGEVRQKLRKGIIWRDSEEKTTKDEREWAFTRS